MTYALRSAAFPSDVLLGPQPGIFLLRLVRVKGTRPAFRVLSSAKQLRKAPEPFSTRFLRQVGGSLMAISVPSWRRQLLGLCCPAFHRFPCSLQQGIVRQGLELAEAAATHQSPHCSPSFEATICLGADSRPPSAISESDRCTYSTGGLCCRSWAAGSAPRGHEAWPPKATQSFSHFTFLRASAPEGKPC